MNTSAVFERSRRRIIAAIMGVLVVLFAATLIAIYSFSYAEVYDRDSHMLENYVSSYIHDQAPQGAFRQELQRGPSDGMGGMGKRSAPFYAVLFDAQNSSVTIENMESSGYSNDDLVALAQAAINNNNQTGLEGGLMYAVERGQGFTLVGFMDNTLVTQSISTLFRYTLIVGLIALVALFFVARWLAGRIVRPMQQAYEAQRQFISDAGHDLKTPVTVVEANAELLQREIGDNQWLSNIRHENKQLGELVGQLLELARAEEQAKPFTEVNLSRVVEAETLSCEPLAYEKGTELQSDISENLTVNGDASELTRLASILLDNALSYGTADMPIAIKLQAVGHHAQLRVSNGISKDDAEHLKGADIFARFTRGNEARNGSDEEQTHHYGLGLAIARAITTAHNGTIQANVNAQNSTITFEVTLPLMKK